MFLKSNRDTMKRVIASVFAAALMFAGVDAFAQFDVERLSVGAGWVNSTMKVKQNGNANRTTSNGFYLGASYELPTSVENLSVDPGLYWEFLSSGGSAKLKEHYLGVPVMAKYNFDFASDTRFFAFAGPTIQLGLSSKTQSGSWTYNNYDSDYTRFDVLLGGGAGVDLMDKWQIKIGYNWGLVNRYTGDASPKVKQHRNEVHLGVAYLF